MTYVIESIRNREDGTPLEREGQRNGPRVELLSHVLGAPMLICYRDDRNRIARTSEVLSVLDSEDGMRRTVITRNTKYTFTKEALSRH